MYYTKNHTISQDKIVNLYVERSKRANIRTSELSSALFRLYEETENETYLNTYNNVANCHDLAFFRHYFDDDGTTKLKKLNRCKHPLCTFCQWVDAKKRYSILNGAVEMLKSEGFQPRHVVITVPNVTIENLRKQLDNLHAVIAQTMRHFKVSGYYRATEITYNKKTKEYHPHAHILLVDYIEINKLCEKTAEIYKKYDSAYERDYLIAYASKCNYVKELCKYITKPSEYSENEIYDLIKFESIKGLRKYSASGVVKDAYKKVNSLINTQKAVEKTELEFFGWFDALYNLHTGQMLHNTDIFGK